MMTGTKECDVSEESPEESRRPANSLRSAYRLLTPSVKVQLLIYFMLKYAMEVLLSESSVVTTYYFGWTTSTVSIFLFCLGLTVLPVNIVVGSYISNMYEDRQILLASEIVVFLGILFSFHFIIPYSVLQYVCSGLIMFVSAEVLEEAGTLARVVADATITLAGFLGQSKLLNVTLLPSLVICIASIVATPLVFSSIVLCVGNVMYAMAYDLNSIAILLIGRLFCGFGSARAVNRRYISDCVPLKIRMQASAGFVSASALGMACGPPLAGPTSDQFQDLQYHVQSKHFARLGNGFGMVCVSNMGCGSHSESLFSRLKSTMSLKNLLLKTVKMMTGTKECDVSEESPEESRRPANSLRSAYRLLTPSVKVQLLIYFMLKYAMEVLLSESSVVTTYYFGWTTSTVSIFLFCVGLTVLPVNIVVGSYISNMYEDRQILLASEIVVFLGILFSFHFIIPYSVLQYVCSGLIMFVSAEVLEGVNLSLLSRVMSSRLSRGPTTAVFYQQKLAHLRESLPMQQSLLQGF
ncbi:spx domain-containing membrane protein at4g22990 [Phtheirospermum japonicum]|uniref:Spx domain-containing membrane protein at4g22990 n=1 Tax=Phtheirospermum japonicum TaxID=374723 RepID=A0A830DD98_9LAMI|nr:spx domain-containing membrane protein at4g22990 [Phtheirospermum japonicum]